MNPVSIIFPHQLNLNNSVLGAGRRVYLVEENLGAANISLSTETLHQITVAASGIEIKGARYPESAAKMIDR